MIKMSKTLALALFAAALPAAHADQGSFTNSGGSTSGGSGVVVTSSVTTPAGALSLNCPPAGTGQCAGGTFSYISGDGTTSINASFTSGTYSESCAGGGKGGHVTCGYSFTGYFSGTLTVNGASQAITGVTSQGFGTGGAAAQGTSAYNSAYAPFYYSDSEQIHRSDDLQGTNQISYGSQGSGAGQFYGAYGIALDSAGRIYVADTYNCRVVRIDNMNGVNWTSYGGVCGSGQGQFYDPSGIALDSTGRIYVMDAGNCRVVRIDDMTGANWISYGAVGSGVAQFSQYLQSVAVDAGARIYVADTGNKRVVRIDDMTGTNWTVLTSSVPVNGVSYSLQSPAAVALDSAGRIYIADNEYYQPAVVRVDDMTGAGWTSLYTGSGSGLNSISVDPSGAVFAGGGGARIVANMAAVLPSSGAIGPIGSYYVFGVTPIPQPVPRPSAISFSPDALNFTQNTGTSATLPLSIANFGGSPMSLGTISASGGFAETTGCGGQLLAGTNCTVNVTFAPTITGPANGSLSISDNSGNLGSSQSVTLSGLGTAPVASVTPASLTFPSQVVNTTSSGRNVTLLNSGTGPLQVTSVVATAPFSQNNTCTAAIAPAASCTIAVSFSPTAIGVATGTLTIAGNAGTQIVTLSGNGSAPVTLSSSSLNFGTLAVGSTSAAKTVTLTNRSSAALNFSSIAITTGFAIASNTCGTSIAAGTNCTVGVTFTPTATGSVAGTLTFTDNTISSPQVVSLSGTGSAPVTLSASSLNFNSVVVGTTSSARNVTLTNRQTAPLNISGIVASASYTVASNNCGATLAAGSGCTVGVTFSPTVTGAIAGALTFTDNAGNSPQVVTLTGSGTAPVTLSTSSLSFGTITAGTTSSARTVKLTNHQTVPLSFTSIAASAGFAIATNTCGTSIAAGKYCSVGVTFHPTAAGLVSGTLIFTDSAGNSPQTVTLSGTGR